MSSSLAAVLGGAAGAVGLVVILVIFLWYCLSRNRSFSRTSETGSSDPSLQGRNIGIELPLRGAPLPSDSQGTRRFSLEELVSATTNFSEINMIGVGKFGEVYKGLLHDGMIVAIKKRLGPPCQEFIEEVLYLSSVRHHHLVSLLGYCQESELQMLVYEYIPNGSVSSHLYGTVQVSNKKLEFKHRLSIALGAARGLAYLHSMNPPLLHKGFTTKNVLVDENFIAKVADAGLRNLLSRIDPAGTSSQLAGDGDIFVDPEERESGRFVKKSDVYSFGVFLFELLSGRAAVQSGHLESNQRMAQWVQTHQDLNDIAAIVDTRLISSFTAESMGEFVNLIVQCLLPSGDRRPTMNYVVAELDRILEKEISLTTVMGEGTPTVILGSQLFTSSR
ncbi:probable leucine-rich repeat receptor-like protein kinase At5g49770 isoform X2 [Aristolochia californica]|uniref:probable leucine-rich repeat receptor-like protein kinase At5g49770 isoform X2 n=1 Tax=Aristolochia californica TaxID=171875 RepID=UPI0035E1A2A7